ncbi:MAG TPA: carboxypeptidase regulatory-like domain-containing protein [Silvibacterium sp.]|nr:carboxypeptidase regulatory-like domain-containing protein [Silvibacterium sp.]
MPNNWMKRVFVSLVFLSLAVWSANAVAQGSGTCTLTGTVYDSSGAVVPGAKIQLILRSSNISRTTEANDVGFFSFVGIPVGTYDLRVESKGFSSFVQTGIVLHIDDQIDLKKIALKAAGTTEEVRVSGAPTDVIPVSSGDVSYTLTDKQVDNLAIVGRNAVELVKLLPGAQNSGGWNGPYNGETAAFNSGAGAYTVNGTRFDQMAVVSDGGSVIDHGFNGGAMVTPNVEAVQEVKVETAAFSAENPNGPIVMSSVTKSGTKEFHGSGYYSIRDGSMNANDWQNNYLGLARPDSRYQYPGFTIGGPVLFPGTNFNHNRDKLFFFGLFEWMRQGVDLGVKKTVVPTADMRTGDFSDLAYLTALSKMGGIVGNPICQGTPGSLPSYCDQTATGKVDTSQIDTGGQVLMNLYHLPNADPTQTGGFNYITDIVNPQPRTQQLVKIDYAASANTHLSARYNHEAETIPFPYGLWQTWPQNPYPGNVVGKNTSHSVAANLTNVFTPTLTNELNFTASHLFYGNWLTDPQAVSASALGYPYFGVFNNGLGVIPNVGGDVTTTGVANFFNEGGVIPNQNTPKWTYTLSENISKQMGTHLLKAGFYWSHETWNQRTGDNSYLDQGAITLASWNSLTTNPYADLLLGNVSMFSQGTQTVLLDFYANEYDFFVQDDWKVNRRLTFNYGARVDHLGWWNNKQGDIAIFNPAKYDPSAAISDYTGIETHAIDPTVPLSGYKPVSFQFLPSVGFSLDVSGDGKTVLRGGFGTNFFRDEGISAGFKLVQNPPLQTFDYFTPSWPATTVTLSGLSSIAPSAALPWPNVAIASESKMPRTYSYNLTLQRQLPATTLLSLAYVGNMSQHMVGWPDTNPIAEGSAEMGQNWPGTWMEQYLAYRPYQNIAGIYPAAHVLNSNYNSFQLTARRGKGLLNYWVSYTFSKGLGYNSADSFDLGRTYGPLPWDRTQQLNFAYLLALPAVSRNHLGNHAVVNGVLDGWQISGITQFASGAPLLTLPSSFPGGYSISMSGTGGPGGCLTSGECALAGQNGGRYILGTPDETPVPLVICNPTAHLAAHQIFNAACFQSPTVGNNGSYSIPYIHGPWFNDSDLSIFKTFKITESKSLQFRAEAFNFLNHPIYGFTDYNPFGGAGTADPGLHMIYNDFGVTPVNGTAASAQSAGLTQAGVMSQKFGHRIMQMALKFYF